MNNNDFNYKQYLASREWALLKRQVEERCNGWCERCGYRRYEETHHITYERIGHESLDDLLAVCHECHQFLSAKSYYDPASNVMAYVIVGRDDREKFESLLRALNQEQCRLVNMAFVSDIKLHRTYLFDSPLPVWAKPSQIQEFGDEESSDGIPIKQILEVKHESLAHPLDGVAIFSNDTGTYRKITRHGVEISEETLRALEDEARKHFGWTR